MCQACIKTLEDPGESAHVNIHKCTVTILEVNWTSYIGNFGFPQDSA